jgi:hypothetical protein
LILPLFAFILIVQKLARWRTSSKEATLVGELTLKSIHIQETAWIEVFGSADLDGEKVCLFVLTCNLNLTFLSTTNHGWWSGSSGRVLLSKHEALSSNPSTAKKKKKATIVNL